MKSYLEFEKDIKGLEEEIEKLKDPFNKKGLSEVETEKISKIQTQLIKANVPIRTLAGKVEAPSRSRRR